MNPDKYSDSKQLERVFSIIRVMGGHTRQGLTTGEIAKATQSNHGTVTRTIAVLTKLSVVQETETPGRWRLGAFMGQLGAAVLHEIQTEQAQLDEIKQLYGRKA